MIKQQNAVPSCDVTRMRNDEFQRHTAFKLVRESEKRTDMSICDQIDVVYCAQCCRYSLAY